MLVLAWRNRRTEDQEPLSDDEQRILHQIEKEFYDSDPEFAREVSETTLYRHALRSIKWAVIVGVAGIIGVIATLQIHFGTLGAHFGTLHWRSFCIQNRL